MEKGEIKTELVFHISRLCLQLLSHELTKLNLQHTLLLRLEFVNVRLSGENLKKVLQAFTLSLEKQPTINN